MSSWERKRILIWGKTRPELSKSYKETVCTGGVLEDTGKLVRLYPIPLRYFDDDRVFKKYQWIEADIRKSTTDPRPESYRVRFDSIAVGDSIATKAGDWSERARWVMRPGNVYRSLEALQEARKRDGTSIGIIKPMCVVDCPVEKYPDSEKARFWAKYRAILEVQELDFDSEGDRDVKPLSPPDFRFKIRFRCDDPGCDRDHEIGVYDWEVDALYFRCREQGDSAERACQRVVARLHNDVCAPTKDTHFLLGNIASHPHIFIIGGLWYPKKRATVQGTLAFDRE